MFGSRALPLLLPRTASASASASTSSSASASASTRIAIAPWTCRTCLRSELRTRVQTQKQWPRSAFYSTAQAAPNARKPKVKPKRRTGLVVFSAAVVLGAAAVAFTEQGRYYYNATRRTGTVMGTLVVCINDYRRTLNKRDDVAPETYAEALRECHKRCAERTLRAMEKNGSIFIKLGQHLTSLNYLLPREWCDTFIPLQDKCPVTSFEDVKTMVERDLGVAFSDVFSDFSEAPLGSASLAQVHIAIDKKSGSKVAVKVQHPILDDWAPLDLALTRFTFSSLKRAFPEYDLTWLSDEMEVSLPQELDFNLEAKNATYAREYFSHIPNTPLVIPQVLWAARRVVVMDYVTGHRPDDLAYLDDNNISRDEVSATLARIFNTMIFARDAPLHCDPHGGNIAVRVNNARARPLNFDIILYDHGLYRTIPLDIQRNYAKLWLAVLDADEEGMRKYSYEVAGITDEQFPLFASTITGRDYRAITKKVSSAPRTAEEKEAISKALGDGMLQQLVQLLGQVPKIMLLILKTNDLTRSLDENLHTLQGPTRSFLILARYAARTVLDEQLEKIRTLSGSILWPPRNAASSIFAWSTYAKVGLKLRIYEWYLYIRGVFGLANPAPGGLR